MFGIFGKGDAAEKTKRRALKKQVRADKKARRQALRVQERAEIAKDRAEDRQRNAVYHDVVTYEKKHAREEKKAPAGSFISLSHVNKIYSNRVQAVFDFNLAVKEKEFIVLVGPSGCGKSTTLRMIAGLESITSGDLFLDGVYANDLEPKDRGAAMVFQSYALYPHMTVYQNMAFGLAVRHIPKDEIDRRVKKAAATLQLTDYLERKPAALSGGQRQRVALGRAIVKNAKVFLMDEPLSNLDAKLRVQMRAELVDLHAKLGSTTIYVTHDQTEAMTMASRIVVMNAGRIQQIGTPLEIYAHPANAFVATFIGSPAMNLVPAQYEKGRIVFGDGLVLSLPPAFAKAHDDFYAAERDRVADELLVLAGARKQAGTEAERPDPREGLLKQRMAELEAIGHGQRHAIIFGIRPEDIHLWGRMDDVSLPSARLDFTVKLAELLGNEYFVHVPFEGAALVAKIPAKSQAATGGRISMYFDLAGLHAFDSVSKRRIN